MAKAGRPSKLTPELTEKIVSLLAEGNYVETVCNYVGLSKETFYRWLKTNPEFSNAIKQALAKAEVEALRKLKKTPDKHAWANIAWFLERRFPDKWGKKDHLNLSGDVGVKITIVKAKKREKKERDG